MIRFEKKPEPQPAAKEVETKRAAEIRESAVEESKAPAKETKRRPTAQGNDDGRLL